MSFSYGKAPGGGDGGGLHFRDPPDVFADTAARDTAFESGGSVEGEHVQFVADRFLAIIIGTLNSPTSFQTYAGDDGTYDDTQWVNRTDAVQGIPGTDGRPGAPGGGAWDSLGSFSEDADNHASNIFVATGIIMPAGRSAYGYRLSTTETILAGSAGIMVFSAALLDSKTAAAAGDTSAAASRVHLPEFGSGGSITGQIHAGLTSGRELLISTSTANQDFAIEVFDYVPSRVQGGVSEARVQELINMTQLSALQGQLLDAQIPAAIMRDAEFTSAAIIALITGNIQFSDLRGMIADGQVPASFMRDAEFTLAAVAQLLGITAAQAGDILVGNPTLSGQDLTFSKADGTDVTITLPAGQGMGTADGRLRFGTAAPADATGMDGDSFAVVDTAAGTATFYEKESGSWVERFTVDLTQTAGDHTRRAAISEDTALSEAEVTAGTSSTNNMVTLPMWGGGVQRYIFIGVPENEDDITDIQQGGLSVFSGYTRHQDNNNDDIIVENHKWWRTLVPGDGLFESMATLTIIQ